MSLSDAKGKFVSVARVKVGIIYFMSSLNKTGLASKINFLRAIQSELWKGEIYQGKPEVVDTGNWAQTQQVVCFFKISIRSCP